MTGGVHYRDASAPDGMRLYAIGDVHGRSDLLAKMHRRIDDEIAQDRPADWRIIHLGDYCDRGPDTRGVMELLVARMRADDRVISLKGNHDEGFRDFVAGRDSNRVFVNYGGDTTVASYGLHADFSSEDAKEATRRALVAALPASHVELLAALPTNADFGDFYFCHAGIRPGVPLERQDPHDLIWIRDEFHNDARLHPKVIVHGHTPIDAVEFRANRVNLDTRAWQSGRLSALVVNASEKRLLEVSG